MTIDTLILGATVTGCAAAMRLGERSLVVCEETSAGAEFADAMRADPCTEHTLFPMTADFRDELTKRGILEGGRLHILALGGVLAKRYLASGCRLLLDVRVTCVRREDDGFLAEFFHPQSGFMTVHAAHVIDTRVHAFMDCRKYLSVLLAGNAALGTCPDDDAMLLCGKFADEFVLSLPMPREIGLPDAMERANAWLSEHRAWLGGAKAASMSLRFTYRFDAPLDVTRDGVRYVPSASFGDVLAAFEGGERL